VACVACGSDLPEGARFCPTCGAEQAEHQEERKLVSILFVDMVGSTARADGADPEDVRDRNQLYFNDARTRIEHYGGIVEKYIGDAVMAVFGTPLAKADDAERAVRAALSVIDGIQELNLEHPGLDLELGGGVHREAVVAIDAAPGEPLATGESPTPPRVCRTRHPGRRADRASDLRAGPALVRAHGARADPERRASASRSEPGACRSAGRTGPPRAGTPLVGRDDELEILPASGTEPSTRPGRTS
jgi:hypothetical protein